MSYSSEVLADSPLTWLRLGGGTPMLDSSGNGRHGGYSGASSLVTGLVSGDSDGAHSFASGSRGQVPDATWLDASSFTVLATITPTGVTGTQTIVGRYDGFVSGVFNASSFVMRLSGNKLECHIFVGNTPGSAVTTVSLTAGTTYDVAATYDGTTVKVYINGGSVASASRAGMNNASMPLTIGSTYGVNEPFAGVIDDVAYFGSVLTATDLATLSTTRTSGSGYAAAIAAFSPLAYYRLNDATSSTTTPTDSSGNGRGGTYDTTTPPTLGITGLLSSDTDLAVDGHARVATIAYAAWMDVNVLTVEAWIKPDAGALSGNHEIVVRDTSGGGGSGSQWRLMLAGGKAQALLWHSTLSSITGSTTLVAGNIYHLVFTYDGANMNLYVNGASDATAVAATGSVTTGQAITIGALGSAGEAFSGVIDEVAYYGSALSSARVAAHYAAASTLPPSGTGSLSLSGSAGAKGAGSGSGAIALTGSAAAKAAATAAGAIALAGTGVIDFQPASGSGSIALAGAGSGGVGGAGAGSIALSGAATAAGATAASGTGSLTLTGFGSATLAAAGTGSLTLGAIGTAVALFVTDLTNALNGRRRRGRGTATVGRAVAPLPPGRTYSTRYDKAIAYPIPDMVDGRPE